MTISTIDDFVGRYLVRQGSLDDTGNSTRPGSGPDDPQDDPRRLVQAGRTMTLESSGTEPRALDLTLIDTDSGTTLLGPLSCRFRPEISALYNRTEDYDGTGEPLVTQISLYRDDASGYKAIYGVMVFGDPDNVGVWGADETSGG